MQPQQPEKPEQPIGASKWPPSKPEQPSKFLSTKVTTEQASAAILSTKVATKLARAAISSAKVDTEPSQRCDFELWPRAGPSSHFECHCSETYLRCFSMPARAESLGALILKIDIAAPRAKPPIRKACYTNPLVLKCSRKVNHVIVVYQAIFTV